MMPSKKLHGLVVVLPLLASACASTLPNYDKHPELARSRGNFLSGDEARARGGVGNYVPRIQARGDRAENERQAMERSADQTPSTQASSMKSDSRENSREKSMTDNAQDRQFGTGPNSAVSTQFLFDTDEAGLHPEAKVELNRMAETIRNRESTPVIIEGFADAPGPSRFNLELSRRRANAVRDYLIEQGVNPERIQVKAYGESKAHSEASNPEDRKVTLTG